MKIWLVNPFDNLPMEGNRAQRYWLMAEAFLRAGHEVVYWTSDFSHARKEKRCFNAKDATKSGQIEMPSPVSCAAATFAISPRFQVRLLHTKPYKKNICIARVISHWKLARDFEKEARKAEKPEVVIASTPPLGLCEAARRIAREANALFIADIQDAWPETFGRILPNVGGESRWRWRRSGSKEVEVEKRVGGWVLKPMEWTAKKIYQEADGLSAVANRYLELASGKYGSGAPMYLAGHCIGGKRWSKEVEKRGSKEVEVENGMLRLVYAGNMGRSYDIETMCKAVERVDGVTLEVAGTEQLEVEERGEGGVSKIKFLGYLGAKELKEALARADVGVVPMFPNSEVGVPGKLADYAMSGLRVIESLGGECEELVKKHRAGTHYEAGNVESLIAAIEEMKRGAEGFDAEGFAAEFAAEPIMDKYVKWVEGLIKCRADWGTTRGPHSDILMPTGY